MLHFIQVHRTLSVKGVQIHSVETKAWRVSAHFITHYQNVWLFFLVLCAISPHQGSIESRKIHPKSPQNQWTPFIQLTFSSFQCFNVFFLLKGLFTIKYFWPKTAKRSFYFSQKPVFQSGSEIRLRASSPIWADEASRARTREWAAKPRGAGSPAPRFRVFSRVLLARLLFTIGGGCGLWARNIAHRTCRKLCVLPTLKQNSVRA